MPKGLLVHPSERVDLSDFEHGTRDYTNERVELESERNWLDQRGRVLDGFRVEIANQTTSPGQFTVYNGNALDRDGRRLLNEDQENASRTATLAAAGTTYYVEVEFVSTESDTDARAFWDPTYDNGSTVPYDGKEFSQNVATRMSYDWQIVTPVSTTGFQISTNASSTRIPIAVLTTNGSGEITVGANPGLSTVPVASVLDEDSLTGSSSFRVRDARFFPNTGSVTVGVGLGTAETKVISNVDRSNGVVTVSTPFVNDHDAGEIARMTGTGRMLAENPLPSSVTASPSTHPDKQRRFFQGDEYRGAALLTSKDASGRDDLNLRSMKDHIDFLAAQLREIRWGTPAVGDNSSAPPSSFTADARYYTNSGGIAGSRTASITIGDGTNSWGDLNGTDDTVFSDAVAALPASGGTIFVKRGTYTFANQVSITKPVRIIGEGRGVVTLNKGAINYIFDITLASLTDVMELSNINFGLDGTATDDPLLYLVLGTIVLTEIQTNGRVDAAAAYVRAKNCRFTNTSTLSMPNAAFQATGMLGSTFEGCLFDVDNGNSGNTALNVGGSLSEITFDSCRFDAPYAVNMAAVTAEGVRFLNSVFYGESVAIQATGSLNYSAFVNCIFTTTATSNATPSVSFANLLNSQFDNCYFATAASGATTLASPHKLVYISDNAGGTTFVGCDFVRNSGSFVEGIVLDSVDCTNRFGVSNCTFRGLTNGVYVTAPTTQSVIDVTDCLFDGNAVADARSGVYALNMPNASKLSVRGCTMKRLTGTTGDCYGIYFGGSAATSYLTATDNRFFDLEALGASACVGVYVNAVGDVEAVISNNHFRTFDSATGTVAAVYMPGAAEVSATVTNNFSQNFSSSGGTCSVYRFTLLNRSVVSNNAAHSMTGTGSVYGIYITDADYTQVVGNTLEDRLAIGAGSYLNVCGNTVELTNSSQPYGISYTWAGTEFGVRIAENVVKCTSGVTAGIYLAGSVGQMIRNLTVAGNAVSNLDATIGIYVAEGLTEGLVIKGNSINESIFDVNNGGILVRSTTPNAHVGLVISDNSVIGATSGGSARGVNGFAIEVTASTGFTIGNNTCAWNRPGSGASGTQIQVFSAGLSTDIQCGSIVGNSVLPADLTAYEIYAVGEEIVVAGNTVSINGTAGVLYLNAVVYAAPGAAGAGTFGYNNI